MREAEEQRREAAEARESVEHVDRMRAEAAQGRDDEPEASTEAEQERPEADLSAAERVARANEQSRDNEREGYER